MLLDLHRILISLLVFLLSNIAFAKEGINMNLYLECSCDEHAFNAMAEMEFVTKDPEHAKSVCVALDSRVELVADLIEVEKDEELEQFHNLLFPDDPIGEENGFTLQHEVKLNFHGKNIKKIEKLTKDATSQEPVTFVLTLGSKLVLSRPRIIDPIGRDGATLYLDETTYDYLMARE